MKTDKITEVRKEHEMNSLTSNLSRQLQREHRVIAVLIAAGALTQDQVEKAREIVDDLAN